MGSWQNPIPHRMPAIDGMRGCAILAMLLQHCQAIPPLMGATVTHTPLDAAVLQTLNSAWVVLDVFFVLSGFLTVAALLASRQRGEADSDFWIRRLLRIAPLYYVVLFVYFYLVDFSATPQAGQVEAYRHQLWFWSFLSNWYMVSIGGFAGPLSAYWFLAVDMQMTVVLWLVIRYVPSRARPAVLLAGIACAITWRTILLWNGVDELSIYRMTISRADGFCVGALTAIVAGESVLRDRASRAAPAVMAACLVALAILVAPSYRGVGRGMVVDSWEAFGPVSIGFTLCALAWGALLLVVVDGGGPARILSWTPLQASGRYSYGMFMGNLFVMGLLMLAGFTTETTQAIAPSVPLIGLVVYAAVIVGATFAVGVATWYAIERHFPLLAVRRAGAGAMA